MALDRIPIHRVSHRDSLFMGGDRELVMLAGLLAAALIFTAQDLRATVWCICVIAAMRVITPQGLRRFGTIRPAKRNNTNERITRRDYGYR